MIKKLIAGVLATITLLLPLAGCQNNNDDEQPTETQEETSSDTSEQYYLDTLPLNNYEFKEIKIATIDSNMVSEELPEDANVVDTTKYERDYHLEERYNIGISYMEIKNGIDSEEAALMLNMAQLNTDGIDVFIQQPDNLMHLAINGATNNLREIDTLALEQEWWCQSMNENLTINNALYVTAGPVAEWYYGAVLAMAYNKKMATDLGIGSLYDKVLDGTWTLEEMQKICTDYTITNAAGKDCAIAFSSGVGPYGLFASAGGKFATIDEEKGIVVDLVGDRNIDILEKILAAFNPEKTVFGNITVSSKSFTDGDSLFYYTTVGYMENFLPSSEIDYGIIPCPKYDAEQKEYISCAWPSSSFSVAIPSYIAGERLEWVGMFLDAYCFLGYEMIKPVKYDSLVKYQVALDETSSKILDIIFGNMYFDINLVSNLGGSRTFIGTTIVQGMGGYTGKYLGISGLISADIAKFSALTKK